MEKKYEHLTDGRAQTENEKEQLRKVSAIF